eukprot:NODE_2126_length_507_cov_601.331878_g1736_i0.p1 GENE.NODE_2126_length_507_cov_601.331878_g1736_i0~~NODE_2126_length_507_cov_601.331878_g1736_i0.p1  ORF type:complete len:145 (+),score=25.72 NODE_2126_length_507_cov_601.331878_g1736_i0:23-436(+)
MGVLETVAFSAVASSYERQAGAIIVAGGGLSFVRMVAKYKPICPILVVFGDPQEARQSVLVRGCIPIEAPGVDAVEELKSRQPPHVQQYGSLLLYGMQQAHATLGLVPDRSCVVVMRSVGGALKPNTVHVVTLPRIE